MVADRERERAALARDALRGDRVGRLARLRDRDRERLRVEHREAVAELRRVLDVDGHPRPLLDQQTADHAGVAGRAAGRDRDAIDAEQLLVGQAEIEHDLAALEALADRLAERVGLLVDLLEHEGLVAALLGGSGIPGDRLGGALDVLAVQVEELRALGRDHDELAVADLLGLARVLEEGDDVRGEERLALAEADHHRALEARADDHLRVSAARRRRTRSGRGDRGRCAVRPRRVAFVVRLEQVGDDLGVRLGAEHVAVGDQPLLQHHVVLHDAVEHDREAVVAARERVRVGLRRTAVGGPARVPDAGRRRRAVRARDLLQDAQIADRADDLELIAVDQRDARRVVAAILETLQPADQERLADACAGVTDDAADGGTPRSRAPRVRRAQNTPSGQRRSGDAELPLYV